MRCNWTLFPGSVGSLDRRDVDSWELVFVAQLSKPTAMAVRARWLGCPAPEKKLIMSECCYGFRGASRSKELLVHRTIWILEAGDGRRRHGLRALPTNRDLLTWISEARDLARASPRRPIVEPTNILLPGGLVAALQVELHNHVWLLAEFLAGLDVGSLLEPATQDIVARGRVGLLDVGRTWMLAERLLGVG